VTEAEFQRTFPVFDALYRAVAAAETVGEVESRLESILTPEAMRSLRVSEAAREATIASYSRPWLRYLLRHDPLEVLSKVTVPVLAVNGSLDRQVPSAENLAGIRRALRHNRDVTAVELVGLNHLFQTAEAGHVGEYFGIHETMSPRVMTLVADWILERFGRVEAA